MIAGFAIALALVTGVDSRSGHGDLGRRCSSIGWFILGFAFYASLFAAAGSLVTRMEELQNVIVPINLTILVSFIISIGALQDPNSTVVGRGVDPAGERRARDAGADRARRSDAGWQIALSLVLLIGCAIALVPVGGRLYEGAVLRTGARVKLRDAWRAA